MSIDPDSVWLISGASSGFGLEFARAALQAGHRVAATARRPEELRARLDAPAQRLLALRLDVTDAEESARAVEATIAHFGRIDVLVNNAGYGYFGAFEEARDAEIERLFAVNVFGLARLTRLVLPPMRRRRTGTIVNLSSIGGLTANPAVSYYAATKFAVEALSESLSRELAPFGVRVLIVEPGPFRTDFFARSVALAEPLADYAGTPAARQREALLTLGEDAKGDPARGVAAVFEALRAQTPPLRLLLGRRAYARALDHLDAKREEFELWRAVSEAADPIAPA